VSFQKIEKNPVDLGKERFLELLIAGRIDIVELLLVERLKGLDLEYTER
jgi:hypothetical protein